MILSGALFEDEKLRTEQSGGGDKLNRFTPECPMTTDDALTAAVATDRVVPLVKDRTRSQSESVETTLGRVGRKEIDIPDYQRDAEQWDARKKSLFIESILNNLTIPAFLFVENDCGDEVVDGQQRLSTLQAYRDEVFEISNDDDIDYLLPQAALYKGKKYSQLPGDLQKVFNGYPLTIIYLPKGLSLSIKLEIFRRINEGGTPLTAQDIRLSYYSESDSVMFLRLAGVYHKTEAAQRMVDAGTKRGLQDPWAASEAAEYWRDWWQGKDKAKGQTPSEMFLWYLVQLRRHQLDTFLSGENMRRHLGMSFRGSVQEALDLFCAQLHFDEKEKKPSPIFPTVKTGLLDDFKMFANWIYVLLSKGLAGLSVDKYKQMALFIGAAVELDLKPEELTNDQWTAIGEFIRTPRQSGSRWLGTKGYPESRGKWSGDKGQKSQCDRVVELISKIVT